METIKEITNNINVAIFDFFEGKINTQDLIKRVDPYMHPQKRDFIIKSGNFLLEIVIQAIEEMPDYIERGEEKILIDWLRKYYEELKLGIKPYETKIPFTLSYKQKNFKIFVEFNQKIKK